MSNFTKFSKKKHLGHNFYKYLQYSITSVIIVNFILLFSKNLLKMNANYPFQGSSTTPDMDFSKMIERVNMEKAVIIAGMVKEQLKESTGRKIIISIDTEKAKRYLESELKDYMTNVTIHITDNNKMQPVSVTRTSLIMP